MQTPKSTWVEKVQRNQPNAPPPTRQVEEAPTPEPPKRETSIIDESRRTSSKFTRKDFIAKNKEALTKVKRLEYDEEKTDSVPSTRRRSRNSSVDEQLIRSSSLYDSEFRPNRRKSQDERFSLQHTYEEVPLRPEMLAEIIKYHILFPN